VAAAMRAAGMLCSTWPKACAGSGSTVMITGGAEPPTTHSGQCARLLGSVLSEPSALSVTLVMPTEEQISSSSCGLTIGLATATPSVKANHSKTILDSQGVLRRVCKNVMGRDYGIDSLVPALLR